MARKRKIYLILDNIRSVYNVGSIFRTADAAGVAEIFLCGLTPTPLDRFGRRRADLAKVALGAEQTVPWKYSKNTAAAVTSLKNKGVKVVAVEQNRRSVDYKKIKVSGELAFVFGNEVGGVAPAIIKKCDAVCEIAMKGKKESLNVSVAVGVVLFGFGA